MYLVAGEINVGDGSYPAGANFIGTEMRILVFDDDGPDNLPGTVLDSITILVEHYNWISFSGLDAVIEEGDFYIGMKQLYAAPNAAPVGIDEQNPVMVKSFSKLPGGEWALSSYQDFMIRALTCEVQNEQRELGAENYSWYQLARVSDFNPEIGETPEDGTFTVIDSLSVFYYRDTLFYTLAPGYYAYAVKIFNEDVDTTGWYYTNVLHHQLLGVIENKFIDILVYPNPVSEDFTLKSGEIIQFVNIVNVYGQSVFNRGFNEKRVSTSLESKLIKVS